MADGTISVSDLFAKADELADEREATLEKQQANREVLRNLDKMGMLSKKESEALSELYPVRERKRGENGDAVAAGE